ncbi:MAG: zinc ABC transporter substrate-binding protein [Planctomycetes bacterium]|nr:zinc ABC transporter substrate-binding protein [Planctomycetota bacterium]
MSARFPISILALRRVCFAALGAGAGALFSLTSGCGTGTQTSTPPAKMELTASIFPLYDWAKEVAGSDADVYLLEGEGGDPHSFSPSMRDIGRIGRSRALLVVGLGLDPWSHRAIESAGKSGNTELLEAGMWVERRKLGAAEKEAHAHHAHAAQDHDHGDLDDDPHVWLDPNRAAQITERLGEEFARLDAPHAEGYRARAKAYAARLRDLALEFAETSKPARGKQIVTMHDAYGYLLELCGIKLAGVMQIAPGLEPSAQDVSAATAKLREIGQRVVFSEAQNESGAKALAEALGVKAAPLDPLERGQAPSGSTYIERMRYNVKTLVENLQ